MKHASKKTGNNLDKLISVGLGIILTFTLYAPSRILMNDISNHLYEQQLSATSLERYARSTKNIFYCDTKNTAQMLDIYVPKEQTAPVPLVVFIHGGGWEYGDKVSKTMSYYGESLLQNDIAVASLNYRLHPASHYPDAHHDIRCASEFLMKNATKYGYLPDRWGVMGDSAGAELAAYELQAHVDAPYKAFVGLYGPYDLALQLTRTPRHDVNAANFLNTTDIALARAVSPINLPVKTSASHLLIHGKDDAIVPFEQSQQYFDTLSSAGAKARLVEIRDSGHYVSPTSNPGRETIRQTITNFFVSELK